MGIGDGIGTGLVVGFISFCLLFFVIAYGIIDYIVLDDEYEVAAPIKPQIKLVTDGKTVDTVYVYKFE